MKTKDKLITAIMCLSIFIILIVSGNTKNDKAPNSVYQVYLNGQKMGMIASKDELYDLINEEQRGIKEKYNVDKVYPPLGFEIVKYVTYDNDIVDANKIYDKIKDQDDFTIEGYKVTITSEEEGKEDIVINVLDENLNPCTFFVFKGDLVKSILDEVEKAKALTKVLIDFDLNYNGKLWNCNVNTVLFNY